MYGFDSVVNPEEDESDNAKDAERQLFVTLQMIKDDHLSFTSINRSDSVGPRDRQHVDRWTERGCLLQAAERILRRLRAGRPELEPGA
jgi:hypothetical protein